MRLNMREKSLSELLALYSDVMGELRQREIIRTANNPIGDIAEYLFCDAFGWMQEPNSSKSFDAVGDDGTRYQIKGRRIHAHNKSRQLGAIRDLEGFDVLAAVLFDDDFQVMRAALIPADVVKKRASYVARTNSNRFMLQDVVWQEPGVQDVTARLLR